MKARNLAVGDFVSLHESPFKKVMEVRRFQAAVEFRLYKGRKWHRCHKESILRVESSRVPSGVGFGK